MRDKYKKTVRGLGYLGEGQYRPKDYQKLYWVWTDMIKRVNVGSFKEIKGSHQYKNCKIVEEWYCFQNFLSWCLSQKGHDRAGWQLDKDILSGGCKLYGPETCCFVPSILNNQMHLAHHKQDTGLMLGVTRYTKSTYKACWTEKGIKEISRETFNSQEDAFQCYKKNKERVVRELAEFWKEDIESRVYQKLLNYNVKPKEKIMTIYEIQLINLDKESEIFYRKFLNDEAAERWCNFHSDEFTDYKILNSAYEE